MLVLSYPVLNLVLHVLQYLLHSHVQYRYSSYCTYLHVAKSKFSLLHNVYTHTYVVVFSCTNCTNYRSTTGVSPQDLNLNLVNKISPGTVDLNVMYDVQYIS